MINIAIIGAGYVGLPLAIAFSKYFYVTSYDINIRRIKELKLGIDVNLQHKKKEIFSNRIEFTNDPMLLKKHDVYIITVPTPINPQNKPDLKMLSAACITVAKVISKNSYIVFESTTYPGCTEDFCIPLLEKHSKLFYNKDFFVGYSPERVNPGDKINTLENITKIVGANDKKTLFKLRNIYNKICKKVYTSNSIQVSESAKVIENIQRDVNIALVNELSILFNKLNISTNEVLKAAKTKWNFHHYSPGLVGGHCISVDPYYLYHKAKLHNYKTKLILSGRQINESMGKYIAKKTTNLLSSNNIDFSKARVAILGFTFKDNIPDIRNTKIIQIVNELHKHNIIVNIFDSLANKREVKKLNKFKVYKFQDLKKYKYDAIILAVSHNIFLKKINFYNRFYKNKQKKIFIDIKNNYSKYDLEKNKFKFFQL